MKKGFAFVLTIGIGLLGIAVLYQSTCQYLLEAETLYDYGLPTKAYVIGESVVEKRDRIGTGSYRDYLEITPVLTFEHPQKTVIDTARQFTRVILKGSTDDPSEVHTGDTLSLLVNPTVPEAYIVAGEADPNNWVGFILWGGIGAALMFWFYRRFKSHFPKEAETRQL
ncbi:MAG: hypothetical protein RIF36_13590 [Imperialibacter sp.]|uniref:hypothetical protein n=1 Tax=Imperialibacter sp. TaxID=2038411 RepID=UPI0032EF22FA